MRTPKATPQAPRLTSIGVENYKAIRRGGMVRLNPLTVCIGNNGSGKSSLLEAARTYQSVMWEGLDKAFATARGFEHVRNKRLPTGTRWATKSSAISLRIKATLPGFSGRFDATLGINSAPAGNRVFIQEETIENQNALFFDRSQTDSTLSHAQVNPGKSVAREWLGAAPFTEFVQRWQFVLLNPDVMGEPRAQSRIGGRTTLAVDGSNLAEYLLDLGERSPAAFEEVVQTMAYVLPYAAEVQPTLADDLERRVYLELVESTAAKKNFRVPGWLFSTGTLRVLAIIALLKDPNPPPVIFIEAIENGLDPRTVGLVVDLLKEATGAGRTQVIATSHSPYLLDLLELEDLVLCQRDTQGEPKFHRAGSDKALKVWRKDFTPGKLYAMGRLPQMGRAPAEASMAAAPHAPEGGWDDAEGDV